MRNNTIETAGTPNTLFSGSWLYAACTYVSNCNYGLRLLHYSCLNFSICVLPLSYRCSDC